MNIANILNSNKSNEDFCWDDVFYQGILTNKYIYLMDHCDELYNVCDYMWVFVGNYVYNELIGIS